MKRSGIGVAAVATALFLASGFAVATDLVCTALSSGGTWHNVLVPVGMSCTLENTRVTGNVTVQTGGTLVINTTATGDTTINGDIKGDGCDFIELQSPSGPFTGRIVVGGNVTIQNCTGISFSGSQGRQNETPATVLIGGNVKCDNNAGGCVFDYSVIGGNLECSGNFDCDLQSDAIGKNLTINNSDGGGAFVDNSSIGGDVKCSGNTGGVASTPNTVAGTKSGQCSGI